VSNSFSISSMVILLSQKFYLQHGCPSDLRHYHGLSDWLLFNFNGYFALAKSYFQHGCPSDLRHYHGLSDWPFSFLLTLIQLRKLCIQFIKYSIKFLSLYHRIISIQTYSNCTCGNIFRCFHCSECARFNLFFGRTSTRC